MANDILEDMFKQVPTGPLYHYTTQEGLKGIIENNEIWCTHTQYLSDSSEFSYALKLLSKIIDRRFEEEQNENIKLLLSNMNNDASGGVQSINVCVGSFSEAGDSLSQWRAYGSETSGFAIGIFGDKLAQHVKENEFFLACCLYVEEEQNKLLDALIDKSIELDKIRFKAPEKKHYPSNIVPLLNKYAPILKDPSFNEEKEWRIISPPMSCSSNRFDHRLGRSMLIPYYKFPLEDKDGNCLLDQVVIGPTPHPDQSYGAIASLLVSRDLVCIPGEGPSVEILQSTIPFRNW